MLTSPKCRLVCSSVPVCSSAGIRLLKLPMIYKCKTKGDRAFSYSALPVSSSVRATSFLSPRYPAWGFEEEEEKDLTNRFAFLINFEDLGVRLNHHYFFTKRFEIRTRGKGAWLKLTVVIESINNPKTRFLFMSLITVWSM